MIYAWEIYAVMQLDKIIFTAYVLFALLSLCAVSALADVFFNSKYKPDGGDFSKRVVVISTLSAMIALSVGVITPDTKTAAAMMIMPVNENDAGSITGEEAQLVPLALEAMNEMQINQD